MFISLLFYCHFKLINLNVLLSLLLSSYLICFCFLVFVLNNDNQIQVFFILFSNLHKYKMSVVVYFKSLFDSSMNRKSYNFESMTNIIYREWRQHQHQFNSAQHFYYLFYLLSFSELLAFPGSSTFFPKDNRIWNLLYQILSHLMTAYILHR